MLMLELVKQKHIMAKGAGPLIDGNNTSLGIQNLTYEDTLVYSNDSNVDRLALKEKKVSEILKDYQRILFKTHFITPGENIAQVIKQYTGPHSKPGDIIFVSDKAVAISQNRVYKTEEIKPGFLARLLSRFVYKSPYGMGLRIPERMELAIKIAGPLKIIFAAVAAAVGKIFKVKGLFYKILGHEIRGIDGHEGRKPPYFNCIILPANNPDSVAAEIARETGREAIVADVNDLEGYITGYSSEDIKKINFREILRDNPMGQDDGCTPIGIIRPLFSKDAPVNENQ